MNLKRKKKGFTIVELVIVLAVVGILAAILIPTFVNVVNKANEAKDKSLVYNLNKAIIIEQTNNDGKAYSTMHDTLVKMDENQGFGIDRIKVQSKNSEILWDSVNNRFVMVTTDKNNDKSYYNGTDDINYPNSTVKEVDLWKITDTFDPNSPYSTYYTGTETSVTTSKGFDAGNTNVNVTYDNETNQNVVIRTNGASSTLTIKDRSLGTIYHYGTAGALNIIQCHTSSYHEKGEVAFAEIATGRIVLEENSKVEHIHLNTSEVNDETVFNNITVAKAESVEMPEFSRDPIEIDEDNGTLVVALQDGTKTTDKKDYVWLTAVGIYEQVTVSDSKTEAKDNFAATSETTSDEQKTAAQQIANNISATVGGNEYTLTATTDDNGETWTYTLTIETNENITANVTVAVETKDEKTVVTVKVDGVDADKTTQENGLTDEEKTEKQTVLVQEAKEAECVNHIMFNNETGRFYYNCPKCGLEFGTEEHPYLISNAAEFEALIKLRDWTGYDGYYLSYRTDATGNYYEYLYAELTQDIDCSTINYPTGYSNVYYLILDGKNHILSNMSEKPFNNGYGITMKNITFDKFSGSYLFNYCYYGLDLINVTFSECTCDYIVTYPLKGAEKGDFYCKNVNFNDCSFNSVFSYIYDAHLEMENCTFNNCTSKSGSSLLAYGGYHYYSGYAFGLDLHNVDIRDSHAYGGAYIYYGGSSDFPINFENCDISNTLVSGGNGMAVGGFIGNASSSHVTFNYCTFDGRVESISQIAAGFIGQPNNSASYCLISNSTISASTVILNKGASTVAVFNGQGNNYNNNNNHFYGTLQSTGTKTNATLNGFSDSSFAKYNALATSADFTLDANGTITYTGSQTFDKIVISQKLSVDNQKSGLGGYPWDVAPRLEVENVSGSSVLGTIQMINNLVQVVDEENLELVRYSTTDTSLLSGNCIDENQGVYLNNGTLVLNSKTYDSGAWYIFSDTSANSTRTTFTISVLIEIFSGDEIVCGVPLSYTFTPSI